MAMQGWQRRDAEEITSPRSWLYVGDFMYFYGRNRSDVVGTDEDCTGIRDGGEAFRENASGNKVFVSEAASGIGCL